MLGHNCLSLCFFLIILISADSAATNKTIRLGYFVYYIDYAGAINVAIENAQNDGFMRDYNFRYNFYTHLIHFKICSNKPGLIVQTLIFFLLRIRG